MAIRHDYRAWTAQEDAKLRAMYPHHTQQEIAEALGRTLPGVANRVAKLGLRKSSNSGQFRPGHKTWNKGLPFEAGGRSVDTRFKRGHKPHTWNPIGHIRQTKEGYLEKKMTDTCITRRDYVALHHLVWKAAGRQIPRGHALVFRDGNKRNFAMDNLELVTRAELMRRNSVHRLPKDVALAVQAIGALRREINKRNTEEYQA